MRELPLLLNTEMVKAVLDGRKTQTRRLDGLKPINTKPNNWSFRGINNKGDYLFEDIAALTTGHDPQDCIINISPPYQVGDMLYVREKARLVEMIHGGYPNKDRRARFIYEADGTKSNWTDYPDRLKPLGLRYCVPNGCYKELARIWLEVIGVRVERVQKISVEDIYKEGCPDVFINENAPEDAVFWFQNLWDSLYPGSWERNDWVWVTEFKRKDRALCQRE